MYRLRGELPQAKVARCAPDVCTNLLLQSFHRCELNLIANASQKENLNLSFGGYFQWMKIQQVTLDGE